ncbi:MAG: amidophosphoribosyltransferase [Burkholderiaceae bacterium]
MCGVVGIVSSKPVNQMLYDGLLLLQHRGQDASGIVTWQSGTFSTHRGNGMVRDVFRTRNMRSLPGRSGIGHVRYPTAGASGNAEEAQPFYVNAPFGITFAHNGNLTNSRQLKSEMFRLDRRHINTDSDSEVLLNVFANALQESAHGVSLDPASVFDAISEVHRRVRGGYACVAEIAGYGVVAFRDPFGIRPLCYGIKETDAGTDYIVASESVAVDGLGFSLVRDIQPGEAVFIDNHGGFHSRQCAEHTSLNPCIFEFVYFARPDSIVDGASVYSARLRMGELLAERVASEIPAGDIDVVMPIPDTSRPSAMQLAMRLNIPYREGFIKNRYVGRTFIMPGQEVRKRSVRQKLNAMSVEFKGRSVLLVDDSIVRGTTSREIIQLARDAGARKVYFASAAPPVRFPNVYGIDMPTRGELIAHGRTPDEVCRQLGADALVYQSIEGMARSITETNPRLTRFDSSCFDGHYITGDVDESYLDRLAALQVGQRQRAADEAARNQLDLALEPGLS